MDHQGCSARHGWNARLGVAPERCLAIEDSNPGVAAGAITVMVPDIVPPTEASRAKCIAVLPDLAAVLTMLQKPGELIRPSSNGTRRAAFAPDLAGLSGRRRP
jgi:hypothetical protein